MLFSIICLTYKRPELLNESVYSVLQQTYTNWELIIINDYELQTIHYNHPQIKIFNLKEKFKNIADKRNFGKSKISGDFILNLDDDDLLLPNYLENLKKLIGNVGWIMAQKPIIYYNEASKIHLSPVPQTNTFVYSKQVAQQFDYEFINNDELNTFYVKIEEIFKTTKKYAQLKNENYGYVWRQDIDIYRKYSLTDIFNKKISNEKQHILLTSIPSVSGDIILNPKWNKDYISIIKNNIKIINPMSVYDKNTLELAKTIKSLTTKPSSKEIIENNNQWQSVKPTWENAVKFINAIKSRGILSTTLDIIGIDKTKGEKVSDFILNQRKLSCFGNKENNISPCTRLKFVDKKGHFCGGCGCGQKDLARLDADTPEEYTKLHYPYLECPLKKPGFSNYYINIDKNPSLSIIIPVLNDNEELNLTIQSIRETSPENVEIIVIDDKSDTPAVINDKNVKLFRFDERKGAGQARHFGAIQATSKHLLFIDSHMRFTNDWYNNAISRMINNPKTLWCGVCLGLDENNMDVNKPKGAYTGADLVLYVEKDKTIFDGKWRNEIKDKDDYEISCVMGACYFIHKDWFFHIRGLEQTMMWGSEEPILSIKSWLAGGDVKLMKSVRIGHKFRKTSPYTNQVSHIQYNKLAYMYMLFSDDLFEKIKNKFIKDSNFNVAIELVEKNKENLNIEKEYYKTIFNYDMNWLCNKFNINT